MGLAVRKRTPALGIGPHRRALRSSDDTRTRRTSRYGIYACRMGKSREKQDEVLRRVPNAVLYRDAFLLLAWPARVLRGHDCFASGSFSSAPWGRRVYRCTHLVARPTRVERYIHASHGACRLAATRNIVPGRSGAVSRRSTALLQPPKLPGVLRTRTRAH